MNRDSSINNIRNFERLSEVLAQLGISVRDAAGNFRKVSEVIDDILAMNRRLPHHRLLFEGDMLIAEAYDLIASGLETRVYTPPEPREFRVHENSKQRYIARSSFWTRSPFTGNVSQWFATTRNPYGQNPHRSINGDDDCLDMWRYTEMDRTSFKPRATKTQTDEINMAAQESINDFLAEFKIVERKAG